VVAATIDKRLHRSHTNSIELVEMAGSAGDRRKWTNGIPRNHEDPGVLRQDATGHAPIRRRLSRKERTVTHYHGSTIDRSIRLLAALCPSVRLPLLLP
jgi:hypothetical protein